MAKESKGNKKNMIKSIIQYPNETLRKVQLDIHSYKSVKLIIEDMFETVNAVDGLGLSAIQIGYPLKLFVLNPKHFIYFADIWKRPLFFPNVTILKQEGNSLSREGCLSIPGFSIDVARPTKMTIQYGYEGAYRHLTIQDQLVCAVLSHEIDHCNGRLIIDYDWSL